MPQINSFSSPYSYYSARILGNAFISGGVGDSAALYNKLYVNEDDPITYLCVQDQSCKSSLSYQASVMSSGESLNSTIAYLRRDIVTSAVRSQGLYMLDLNAINVDSFANTADLTDTDKLWSAIHQYMSTAANVNFTTKYNYAPEVAVFVDGDSAAYEPLNQNGYINRGHSFITGALEQLSQAGIVWREYLLSDLLNGSIQLNNIKFAVFLNAFKITPAVQKAIQSKLENSGRALMYIYAPGLYGQDTDAANSAQISAITGMNIAQGWDSLTNPQTRVEYNMPITGTPPPLFGITDGGTWSPWFYINDPNAVTLGIYTANGLPSLAWKKQNGYSVFYSALPSVPETVFRDYAMNAGVHLFSNVDMDSVDAGGNTMVLNGISAGTRTITLPWTVNEIDEDTDTGTTTICKNCNQFNVTLSGPDSHIYRWK